MSNQNVVDASRQRNMATFLRFPKFSRNILMQMPSASSTITWNSRAHNVITKSSQLETYGKNGQNVVVENF